MNLPVQTWQHQKPATEYLLSRPNSVLNIKMGGGKSKIVIDALRDIGTSGKKMTLILCPSAVLAVWRGQFHVHAHGLFDVVIMDGSGNSDDKADRLTAAISRRQAGGLPLVVVVNYELFWRPKILSVLSSQRWEVMIADEVHKLKSPSVKAKASHAAWHLGKCAAGRIGMTGTLAPHSPMDVFAQYRFLQENIFGRYVTHFRQAYCVMNKYIPAKVDLWVNQEQMQEKINLIRYSISDDFLILPEKQDIIIPAPLAPAGLKLYKQMRKDSIALIRQLRDGGGEVVKIASAPNGAVTFLRLLQLAQGYVGDEEGNEIDTDTQKRKALLDLLESTDEPVVCYGWFKHDLKCVEDCCLILGKRYGELSGRRKDLTDHGKMPEDLDVLGVQCKSGSSGIDLTRSSIGIILNSGMLSPGDFDQMIARQHRPGQTKNVRYYHLITPGTVDETIAKARQEKRNVVEAILNSEEFF